jgi:hypothetical protein
VRPDPVLETMTDGPRLSMLPLCVEVYASLPPSGDQVGFKRGVAVRKVGLLLRAEDRLDISMPVKDAYDLDTFLREPIEDHILSPGKASKRGPEFVPPAAEARGYRKELAFIMDFGNEAVGISDAVLGDIQPNVVKIGLRLLGEMRPSLQARALT